MGGFASFFYAREKNRVRWKQAPSPHRFGVFFGEWGQNPREALVLNGTQGTDIATSQAAIGAFLADCGRLDHRALTGPI